MLEEDVQTLTLRLDEAERDADSFDKRLSRIEKDLLGLTKKLDFVLRTITLQGTQRTPQGPIKVQTTLAQLYKEATYHAAPVVGSPQGPSPDLDRDPEPERTPDPPPDPAEEAAARERLAALREELRS